MKKLIIPALAIAVICAVGVDVMAKKKQKAAAPAPEVQLPVTGERVLLFNSGFELDSRVVPDKPGSQRLITVGTDNSVPAPNKWGMQPVRQGGYVRTIGNTLTEGYDTLCSRASIIDDPTQNNKPNKVMEFWIYDIAQGKGKSRVQLDAGGVNLSEFYQSVRVYLHPDMAALKDIEKGDAWLTLLEWWNDPPEKGNLWLSRSVWRISVNLAKAQGVGEDLYFDIHGQDVYRETPESPSKFPTLWEERRTDLPVKFGKWFTMETYYKDGDENTGRFCMTIQYDGEPKVMVFDIHNRTKSMGKTTPGVRYFSPLKMYTSKQRTLHMKDKNKKFVIYWDDLKIWGVDQKEQ